MSALTDLAQAARLARAERPQVALAVATLVDVEGSSYRRPGARLLVDAEGRVLAGAISGGCLEADVATYAGAVTDSGIARLLRYDLRDDLDAIWGFGSACDGIATVLLEPLADSTWLDAACAVRDPAMVLTLRVRYLPNRVGEQWVAERNAVNDVNDLDDVIAAGSGSDGARHTPAAYRPGTTLETSTRPDTDPDAWSAQSSRTTRRTTDGPWRVLEEVLSAPIALHLVGAGRGAEAFARLAEAMGWEVTVIDHRDALLDALVLPESVRTRVGGAAEVTSELRWDRRVAVALLTHIYDTDYAWLRAVLAEDVGYIGILGSRQRAARLMERLQRDGITVPDALHSRIHAPIGLDLGGETPESIALAAIAEIEAAMHGRRGGSLRDRRTSIHERDTRDGHRSPADDASAWGEGRSPVLRGHPARHERPMGHHRDETEGALDDDARLDGDENRSTVALAPCGTGGAVST